MKQIKFVLLLMGFLALGLVSGQAFRYGSAWWQSGKQITTVDRAALKLPESTASAKQKLIVISLSTCPVCQQSKAWLSKQHIEYSEYVIDQSPAAKSLAHQLKLDSVPTFLMGNQMLVGFDTDALESLLGR